MNITTLFLIHAFEMMRVCKWFNKVVIAMSLSWLAQSTRLLSLHLINGWNEKQLGKMSIRQKPGENSTFKGSKEGHTSLNLLSLLMIDFLMFSFW